VNYFASHQRPAYGPTTNSKTRQIFLEDAGVDFIHQPHSQYAVDLLMRAADVGDRKSIDDAAAKLGRALSVEGLL
jgi:hypothetical protein